MVPFASQKGEKCLKFSIENKIAQFILEISQDWSAPVVVHLFPNGKEKVF